MRASTTRQPPSTTASTSAATTIRTQCAARRLRNDGVGGFHRSDADASRATSGGGAAGATPSGMPSRTGAAKAAS